MNIGSFIYLMQQMGAILLTIIVMYKIQHWMRKSQVEEKVLHFNLMEAKSTRDEAWDCSRQMLSSIDMGNDQLQNQHLFDDRKWMGQSQIS